MKKKVCMIVPNPMVKGGIAAVVNGYRGSKLEREYQIIYVESYKDGNKFEKLCKGIGGYFHFIKVLFFEKPDLVHIHSSFGASFYRKIPFIYMAKWARIPIVNHIHGADFDEFYMNAPKNKKRLIKKVYNKCAVLIVLSEEWKQKILQIVPEDKIVIIENYSTIHSDSLEQRKNRKCNDIVLFLGELGKRKGCYDIPAVVQKVKREIPTVKFVLAGAGSKKDELSIKKLIEANDVIENVIFSGWVRGSEKDRLLREADVFFLPSYNEGMPMSILDAMGYGLPVVSTNVGGIPRIVHNGDNGYCCEPGDINEFSKRITLLLRDTELKKKCESLSYQIVKESYSIDAHIDRILKIYKELIK